MSVHQIRFDSEPGKIIRHASRLSVLTLLVVSACFAATSVTAADKTADANARYQADKAVCNSGQSNQDRATCLKEAGAALAASRRKHVNDDPAVYTQNALARCNALPPDERDACQRRVQSDATSGSVAAGGILREDVELEKK